MIPHKMVKSVAFTETPAHSRPRPIRVEATSSSASHMLYDSGQLASFLERPGHHLQDGGDSPLCITASLQDEMRGHCKEFSKGQHILGILRTAQQWPRVLSPK